MSSDQSSKKAIALHYDQDVTEAPVLKAKGKGLTAEKIIQVAQEHHVPIEEDPALVEVLSKIDLDQQIPVELYEIVAEILAMVYKLEKKATNNE